MTVRSGKDQAIAANRKAFHEYEVLERFVAGIELRGTEVKSIRAGTVNLAGGFAHPENGQLILREVHIAPYEHGSRFNHEPTRPRVLLMRAREIESIASRVEKAGLTIIPLKLFFKRRWVKVELGLCRGRKSGDKREELRRKTMDKETARAMSASSRRA